MCMVMSMAVSMTMIVAAVLMTRSHYTCYRIAKFLDSCLESSLRSLGCIVLNVNCLVVK